jgi:AcrR family transcriptional regulator
MAKESNKIQQNALNIAKKLLQGTPDEEALMGTVERLLTAVQGARAQQEVLPILVRLFSAVRDQLEHQAGPIQSPLVGFAAVLQRVARLYGIEPDQFYGALLGSLLTGMETDEGVRALHKLSTRDKVLEAALEVFSEKGFHVATVDEIAEHAGLGKGTVYRYFPTKEALFNELVRLRLEELEHRALAVLDSQDDVLTMISKYLRIYFEFFERNQRLYRVIVQEHLDVGDQVHGLYIKKVMRRAPMLKRKIYAATQQGVFKDLDFETVFYGAMGFIHGVIQKWLAHDCSYSLMQELSVAMETLFFGFVKKSGEPPGLTWKM